MTITEETVSSPEVPEVENSNRNHTAWWVAFGAIILSISAYVYFSRHGMALGYKDSISHLQIASRIIHSPTAGFAQLGGVWLPLPHLLMLPLVWITPLYYNGFAGSAVSMICYVITCVYIYKTVFSLTRSRIAAVAGTLVFALNPNILYMQSTPMTELLLFAAIAAMTYYTQQWIQTEDHEKKYPYLFASALAAFIGCLTRYEAWVVTVVMAAIILFVAWRQYGRRAAGGIVLSYGFLAGAAIAMWLGWNLLIFGDPLNFQSGKYSKPSLWVGAGEQSVGNLSVASKTYWYAMVENLGIWTVVAMIVSAIVLFIGRRNYDKLPTLGLLAIAPFFVFALYVGQRPLHVIQTTGDLYNVRFGLMMVIPAALLLGFLVSLVPKRLRNIGLVTAVAITLLPLWPAGPTQIVTAREGSIGFPKTAMDTSAYLREHYAGGVILIESFGNESILFYGRVPLTNNVYEGSYQKWNPALSNPPGQQIKWIVMRTGNTPDQTFRELHGSSKLDAYGEVFQNDLYAIYKRKES